MSEIKLYYGQNSKGKWKAFKDPERIKNFDTQYECTVKAIHNNKVYMVHLHKGYDYNYGSEINPIVDIERFSPLYHSVSEAKKSSSMWQSAEEELKKSPDKYVVTLFMIASKGYDGKPWEYGDVMERKFNIKIFPVRVYD